MFVARVSHQGRPQWTVVENETVYALQGDRFAAPRKGEKLAALSATKLLAPIEYGNSVLCLLANWKSKDDRDGPGFCLKHFSAMNNPGDPIVFPKGGKKVVYEAELGVVIGRKCRNVSVDEARNFIMGYTVVNDMTAWETEEKDNFPWLRGKTFDTFCPLGPWIATDVDGDNLSIKVWLNGELTRENHTSKMLWNCREIVSWISRAVTLLPGDIIAMGAAASGPVKPGDQLKFTIADIGSLEAPVQ